MKKFLRFNGLLVLAVLFNLFIIVPAIVQWGNGVLNWERPSQTILVCPIKLNGFHLGTTTEDVNVLLFPLHNSDCGDSAIYYIKVSQ